MAFLLGRMKMNFGRLTSSSSSPTNVSTTIAANSATDFQSNVNSISSPSLSSSSLFFPSGDELIIVNILEFLNSGVVDIIACANVCSDWRRVCESALVDLQFSNHVYSRKILGKVYREIENPDKYRFFDYFSSIKITLPNSEVSQNIIQRLLKTKKCEKLGLRNFKVKFSEIYKKNIVAARIKFIELSKCEVDSLEYFDKIFPNLKSFKFSGTIQKSSIESFVKTTFTNLESINLEIQTEEQFTCLVCPKNPCVNMKEFQLYSKLQNCGDYQVKFNREFFPNMKSLFFSMHSAYNEKVLQNCDLEVDSLRIRARVSSVALSKLTSLVHLEVKTLSSLDNLRLPNLKTLTLDSNYDSKSHTVKLPYMHLPNLESLTISDRKGIVELSNLIQFTKLKTLDIDCDSLKEVKTVRELKTLEDISIGCHFKEGGIEHLADLKITKLRIFSGRVENENMYVISQLEHLKHLEITIETIGQLVLLSEGKLSNLTYIKFYKTKKRLDLYGALAQANCKNLVQIKFRSLDIRSASELLLNNPFPKLRILKLRKSFDLKTAKHLDLLKVLLTTDSSESPLQEIHIKCKGDYTNNKEIQQMIEKSSRILYIQPRNSKK